VLCEINVSSVAPFPDSAIEPLVLATVRRIGPRKDVASLRSRHPHLRAGPGRGRRHWGQGHRGDPGDDAGQADPRRGVSDSSSNGTPAAMPVGTRK
jgi:hypothetical protein